MEEENIYKSADKKNKIAFFVILGLVIAVIFVGLIIWKVFYYEQTNYLIKGVPYNGIYNLFFRGADSTEVSSVLDVLGYWGDERFSISDIAKRFPHNNNYHFSTLEIKKFFEENGYETYRWASKNSGNEINELKKFVNRDKKMPVIVFQKRSPDNNFSSSGYRVVIGIFDRDRKLIVHDHDFGNNYEITFENFEKMFEGDKRAILVIWPSEKTKDIIKGPNYNNVYPERLEIMEKLGNLLVKSGSEGRIYYTQKDYEKAIAYFNNFVNDPDFQFFPPAFKIWWLSNLAGMYIDAKNPAEAKKIIEEKALPLNNRANEALAGWFVPIEEKVFYPYFFLSKAYLAMGETDLAIKNYEEAKKILNSSSIKSQAFTETMAELEKAIYP